MAEIYRKFGRTIRYEHGTLLRIEEAGEAIEDGQTFSCHPIERSQTIDRIDEAELEFTVSSIRSLVQPPVTIERLVVSEGVARHEFGDRKWDEQMRRIHLAVSARSQRAMIDLGDFELADIETIVNGLARCGRERAVPPRIRLAPWVSAAILPSLVGVAPPNVRVFQTAHGVDGKGEPVEDREIPPPESAVAHPNWYRPSYRSRPVRAPLHLRAECDVKLIDVNLPRAIALLAPPDGLLLRVLCADQDDVYPATARVSRIDAVGVPVRWYPYGAGSFGSEMML